MHYKDNKRSPPISRRHELETFAETWDARYPIISASWIESWERIGPFLGNEVLDRWLVRYAETFVIAEAGTVIAYYTLLAGELDRRDATVQASRGMSTHHPIPVAILAGLAVDHRHHQQQQGVGAVPLPRAITIAAIKSASQIDSPVAWLRPSASRSTTAIATRAWHKPGIR